MRTSVTFQNLPSVKKLRELAESPYDLRSLDAKRVEEMVSKACGWRFLYGTQRVDEDCLSLLEELAEECKVYEQMAAMQDGGVMNFIQGLPSEERQVLHTAMRDQFGKKGRSSTALEAAEKAAEELTKLEAFLGAMGDTFEELVVIGIGGSDLGPRALYHALEAFQIEGRKVHFISNVDPDDGASVLQRINLEKTLIATVSKSGTTQETRTNELLVRRFLQERGLDPLEHCVAVTGEGSPMDDPHKYLESFYIWDFVGGRYSATSMVGAVPLAFALGMPAFRELLQGAHEMDCHALEAKGRENVPLLAALLGVWNRNFLQLPSLAVIPYSQPLLRFTAHLQQVDMESNGKRVDKTGQWVEYATGPLIWGEPGTNGQHSFYQWIHQGTDGIPLEFIASAENQYGTDLEVEGTTSRQKLLANLIAQIVGLATGQNNENPNKFFPGNRPSSCLLTSQLNPYSLGALLSLYEHKIAFQGFLWNINSFDQEGVQLGKRLADAILGQMQQRESGVESDQEALPLSAAFLDHLETL